MSSGWTQSKIILGGFVDMLACKKCKRITEMPMRYVNCGHFFCDACIFSQNICFECHIPVRPREIKHYELVAKLLGYCNVIINVITKTKSENLQSLAEAVHQFAAHCNGIVPETDPDSDDEVVESTPPGERSKGRNKSEDENGEIGNSKRSQREKSRRGETGSKVLTEPETKGFVSPTQFSPHQGKNIPPPETEEFLDGADTSPYQGRGNVQPETKGFVSPTQFSPYQKKIILQAETKGFVSPSQSRSFQRKKIVQPETAGFVEPTQSSPRQRKMDKKPGIARFSRKPGSGSVQEKQKNPQGKTAGSVSPARSSQRRQEKKQRSSQPEKNAEPETAGFVDPTQFSPRQRKTNAEPETAGFVDPTQFSPRQRKQRPQAEAKESGNSTDRNKNHIEQELEPETIGYCDKTLTPPGRKKMRLSISKTRKFPSRDLAKQNKNENVTSESPRSDDPEIPDDSPRDNLEKICSRLNSIARDGVLSQKKQNHHRNATLTESTDFVDPTQFEKAGGGSLPPETEGYRDPSQSPVHSEMRKLAKSSRDSKPIDERPKNIESQDKNSDSSEEKDWMEELVKTVKKLQGSNEDLMLAPESADTDETVSRNLTIPETLENVENSTNYQNVPMEIEHDIIEKTILSKHPEAQNISNKSSKSDATKRTIAKVHDDSMEHLEREEECPVHQSKRMKSSALSRRSKNSELSQVLNSSLETKTRKKTSQEKNNIDENVVLDCCKKNSSIQDFDSLVVRQTINEKIEEMVDKTLTKRSRLTKSGSIGEQQKKSPINSSVASEIVTTEKTCASKKSMKISTMEARRSQETRESESHGFDKNAKLVESPKESSCPRPREKLDKENLDATSKQNTKNKPVDSKTRQSIDKPKTPTPKSIPKNINKRNTKGETALHTACVKGHKDYVKMLLEAGANPNTKDNANWTPLQEAVNLGRREICEMLLQAGASANTPAMENRTALHDAATNDKLEEAALLLRFKANRSVYDKFGKRPIDYAVSDEMRVLLSKENENEKVMKSDPSGDSVLDKSIIIPNSKVVVLPSNLNTKNRKLLAQLASKLKVEVAMSFRSTLTHVVVETNDRNITELTYNVMLAILQGKWILNSQWITISSDLNDISEIDLELFEVHGAPNPETPMRARRNEENQNPRLFNNCYFYFAIGQRSTWSYEKFEFTKESLTTLVLGGQGEILHREPDPEVVKNYKLTPFHVAHKPIHPLYKCSHYIIYMPGKDEPRVKYNMPHIKSLPVGWFLECIEKFTLVDPVLMGIS